MSLFQNNDDVSNSFGESYEGPKVQQHELFLLIWQTYTTWCRYNLKTRGAANRRDTIFSLRLHQILDWRHHTPLLCSSTSRIHVMPFFSKSFYPRISRFHSPLKEVNLLYGSFFVIPLYLEEVNLNTRCCTDVNPVVSLEPSGLTFEVRYYDGKFSCLSWALGWHVEGRRGLGLPFWSFPLNFSRGPCF